METSQLPGISSSEQLLNPKEISDACRLIAKNSRLLGVISALGADAQLYLVGGAVREIASGRGPTDLDLASVLTPQEAQIRCERAGIKVVATALKHGTITLVIEGEHIELTTFRVPGPPVGNQFATSIIEDLEGRDFTVNALAVSLSSFELVDLFEGLKDLSLGLLRAVKDPRQRFAEDPLRLLRMIRFGPASRRTIEADTRAAAAQLARSLKAVSPERIQVELKRILVAQAPSEGLREMVRLEMLTEIAPELIAMIGVDQNEFHTEDVFNHTLSVIERSPRDTALRLAALFHDAGKPATLSTGRDGRRHFYEHEVISARIARIVMERLRCSNEEIERVSRVVRLHMRPIECGPAGVRRILRDVAPYYEDWRLFKHADAPPVMPEAEVLERLGRFDQMVEAERLRGAMQGEKLAVNGHDLMAIGFAPGVRMGEFLKSCEDLVTENPQENSRDRLLELARQFLQAEPHLTPQAE